MCDDLTELDNTTFLARLAQANPAIDRRRFAVLGAGAATLVSVPGCMAKVADQAPAMPVSAGPVAITTPDGVTDAWFVTPTAGKHPAVIMWPDIAGLRDAYKTMAARLAGAGYAVLVVNQYYRGAKAPILDSLVAWRTPASQAQAADRRHFIRRHSERCCGLCGVARSAAPSRYDAADRHLGLLHGRTLYRAHRSRSARPDRRGGLVPRRQPGGSCGGRG